MSPSLHPSIHQSIMRSLLHHQGRAATSCFTFAPLAAAAETRRADFHLSPLANRKLSPTHKRKHQRNRSHQQWANQEAVSYTYQDFSDEISTERKIQRITERNLEPHRIKTDKNGFVDGSYESEVAKGTIKPLAHQREDDDDEEEGKRERPRPQQFLMRSLMYCPGNSIKMLTKVTQMGKDIPDVFVPDLEDSVPHDQKQEALQIMKEFIEEIWTFAVMRRLEQTVFDPKFKNAIHSLMQQTQADSVESYAQSVNEIAYFRRKLLGHYPLLIPRLNHSNVERELPELLQLSYSLDKEGRKLVPNRRLDALVPFIDGINVGKIESKHDVHELCSIIEHCEKAAFLPFGSIKLIPIIETAQGVVNAYEICSSAPERVIGVAFGGDDYALDMGIQRNTTGVGLDPLDYARSVVAVAARAAGIPALDTPYPNFKDTEGLIREAERVKLLGFKGKFAIHPSQIPTLDQIYGYGREQGEPNELEYSRSVVAAYEQAQKTGRGSTSLNGRMIDQPVYSRALQVLARAREIDERNRGKQELSDALQSYMNNLAAPLQHKYSSPQQQQQQ